MRGRREAGGAEVRGRRETGGAEVRGRREAAGAEGLRGRAAIRDGRLPSPPPSP